MQTVRILHRVNIPAIALCVLASGCGGSSESAPVTITVTGPDAVSRWNEIAATTINQPADASGTPEEQRPIYANDLATVQIAVYDALVAITRTYQPYAITPTAPADGASQEATIAAAACGVLRSLFPNRSTQYQAACDSAIEALPADNARALGMALGSEVAAGILALRAGDGRSIVLAPYVPGTGPGQFRSAAPANRFLPYVKPFVTLSHAQFRAGPPPALTSTAYASDVAETQALGSANSTTRTAEQTEKARFNTEPPPTFWPRNLRIFAMTTGTLTEHARLLAMLWAAHADASNACFESKYWYNAWRPFSAIQLADTDGNAATTADPAWTPVVPTPNHPEYPAAHSCVAGATAAVLRAYYGTNEIRFEFNSTVTNTQMQFGSAHALADDLALARIAGGMHFRSATTAGTALGDSVGNWVASHAFQPR